MYSATMYHYCVLLCLTVVATLLHGVDGGCYGTNPRPPKLNWEEKLANQSYNYDPTPVVNHHLLPERWDWCDVHGRSYCAPSWNQHIPLYCGSCWLHGTLSATQDRIKIAKGGEGIDVMLARQVLLQCGPLVGMGNGCNGGGPPDVYRYMQDYGLPDEACMLYKADDTDFKHLMKEGKECPPAGICRNCMANHEPECFDIPNPILYSVKSYGPVPEGEEAMMAEIYARGPIVCSMATTDLFDYHYTGGVFIDKFGNATEVDHDVEVVGWGVEIQRDGTPLKYWKIRNSWGTFWGELGFFRLRRGTNELQIEKDCWYVTPDVSMERKVRKGKLVGSMEMGLIPTPRYKPYHPNGRRPVTMENSKAYNRY